MMHFANSCYWCGAYTDSGYWSHGEWVPCHPECDDPPDPVSDLAASQAHDEPPGPPPVVDVALGSLEDPR
jgi:hypothetical protein